jgi:hypothetical protein
MQMSFHSSSLTAPADSIVRQPVAAMRLSCAATAVGLRKTRGKSLTTSLKHRLSLRLGSGAWPALLLFESLPRALPLPLSSSPSRVAKALALPSVLHLANRTLERNMPLVRGGGFMFAPALESKTHLPLLTRRPWHATLRDLPSNTAPAALLARAKLEPLTSCALSSLVFPLAQPGGSFRSLRFEPLLLIHVGQTYTTRECLCFALRTFGNLLRTARLNPSIPTISRFARAAALLFCVALFNSFSSAAPVTSQHPHDN